MLALPNWIGMFNKQAENPYHRWRAFSGLVSSERDHRNDVTTCDHQDNLAPSQDVSKILRIDYPDLEKVKEVMRSKSTWKTILYSIPSKNALVVSLLDRH